MATVGDDGEQNVVARPVEIAGTFTYWRRSSGITTSAKERNMAISSGTLTKVAKRVTGLYLPEGWSSSSVVTSPNVEAQASNSCRPRSSNAA